MHAAQGQRLLAPPKRFAHPYARPICLGRATFNQGDELSAAPTAFVNARYSKLYTVPTKAPWGSTS